MRFYPILFLCLVSGATLSTTVYAEMDFINNPALNPAFYDSPSSSKKEGKATVVVANKAESVDESRTMVEEVPSLLVTQSPKEIASWIEKNRDANPFQLKDTACLHDFLEAASVSMTLAGFHISEFKASKMGIRRSSIRGKYVQFVEDFELTFQAGNDTEVRKVECERKDWRWE